MKKSWSALLLSVALICTAIGGCDLHTVRPSFASAIPSVSSVVSAFPATLAPTVSPSPSPSPSPTVEPATLSPEPEDDATDDPYYTVYTKAGLTSDQFARINELVDSALYIGFFSNTSSLRNTDYLHFIYDFLNWKPEDRYDIHIDDNGECSSISRSTAQKLIHSAFATDFSLKTKVGHNDLIKYSDGNFNFYIDFEYKNWSRIYRIDCNPDGQYQIYMDLVFRSGDGGDYQGKAIAVIQKDDTSIFGFHILSLVKNNAPRPKIMSVSASSYLPQSGINNYSPQNVVDNKNNTAWATKAGVNEWIQLDFAKPQRVSGMILRLGDWTNESLYEKSGKPFHVVIEFSDGTSKNMEVSNSVYDYPNSYELFYTEELTSYIKIIIQDVDYGYGRDGSGPVYISEISPF